MSWSRLMKREELTTEQIAALDEAGNAEAWADGEAVVIAGPGRGLGTILSDDHDCDALGCGQWHVVRRFHGPRAEREALRARVAELEREAREAGWNLAIPLMWAFDPSAKPDLVRASRAIIEAFADRDRQLAAERARREAAEARVAANAAALTGAEEWMAEDGCDCGTDESGTCALCLVRAALSADPLAVVPRAELEAAQRECRDLGRKLSEARDHIGKLESDGEAEDEEWKRKLRLLLDDRARAERERDEAQAGAAALRAALERTRAATEGPWYYHGTSDVEGLRAERDKLGRMLGAWVEIRDAALASPIGAGWLPPDLARECEEWIASRLPPHDVTRCDYCGWPLAESVEKGCVPGNCSYRPDEGSSEGYRMAARRATEAPNIAGRALLASIRAQREKVPRRSAPAGERKP